MRTIFGLFLCLIFSQFIFAQSNAALDNCVGIKFKCVIITNDFYSPISQHLSIYLDEKDFSKDNLKMLFNKLSKQYIEVRNLTIGVTTDKKEIAPLLDNGRRPVRGNAISEQPDPPDKFDYYLAVFFRRDRAAEVIKLL